MLPERMPSLRDKHRAIEVESKKEIKSSEKIERSDKTEIKKKK